MVRFLVLVRLGGGGGEGGGLNIDTLIAFPWKARLAYHRLSRSLHRGTYRFNNRTLCGK